MTEIMTESTKKYTNKSSKESSKETDIIERISPNDNLQNKDKEELKQYIDQQLEKIRKENKKQNDRLFKYIKKTNYYLHKELKTVNDKIKSLQHEIKYLEEFKADRPYQPGDAYTL